VIRWASGVRAPPGEYAPLGAYEFAVRALSALEPFNPTVTSWWRPGNVNVRAGGQRYSRHLWGLAMDFRSRDRSPSEIRSMVGALMRAGLWAQYEPELRDRFGRVTRYAHVHAQDRPGVRE